AGDGQEPAGGQGGRRAEPDLRARRGAGGEARLRGDQAGEARLSRRPDREDVAMKIAVKSLENRQLREIEVPETIFGYPYNEHLTREAVQAYLAGLRRGTHKTKTRAEVSGSGKKLWRQKGTGRARTGDIRNPKWRHGGTVWGPVPHTYEKH